MAPGPCGSECPLRQGCSGVICGIENLAAGNSGAFGVTMSTYEVVIIGAGPAGLFAALSLENLGAGKVLLVEQGPDLAERQRDIPGGLLCGWGGAGAFS